ncbi:acetylornithine deacetylase [Rahnella sp. SAP-1]|uniref:Acetylornithine deacetylase n=1 Tax=Rouxiella aceris TaxID=2703884 RepID=A0A848MKD5_9GAMM|nr:acetylornithine deacetylase [Rouxiella aceris]NMP27561.1 acetylornithine deacetylase [Rouxiella aceris]
MNNLGTRELLADLIAFDTVSRNSNLALMAYIQNYLAGFGISSQLIPDAQGEKANLLAVIGPQDRAGIVLSGHTDVVPVDGQQWASDPFCLQEREGRLYGRGTADMKSWLAAVLALVPELVAQPLRLPVWLAFSYDEEVGCKGVPTLLTCFDQQPLLPAACIVGEPTEMRPIFGHKGKIAFRCEVTGHATHSAYTPQGVNAIEYAVRIIQQLMALAEKLKLQQNLAFDPPFSTLQTGVIRGGEALNIVPASCQFDFEIRTLPGVDARQLVAALQVWCQQQLLPEMQRISADCRITFSPLSHYPGLEPSTTTMIDELLSLLAPADALSTVAFGTEGGLFQQHGIPTLVCGPGAMAQGHKPDEFISLDQLAECEAFLRRLCRSLQTTGAPG